MSFKSRARHELAALTLATAYFGAWIASLMVLKTLLLAEYHIRVHRWSAALLGILVLAKVVLVLEHVSFGAWLRTRPAWVHVILRTLLYSLGVLAVLAIERGVSERSEHGGFLNAIKSALAGSDVAHLWTNALCISGALLGYNALSVVRLQLGEGNLRRLFLTPLPIEPVTRTPSTTPRSKPYATPGDSRSSTHELETAAHSGTDTSTPTPPSAPTSSSS